MEPFAGLDLSPYFPAPLYLACNGLEITKSQWIEYNDSTSVEFSIGVHKAGGDTTSALYQPDWYTTKFIPKIKEYRKGNLVWAKTHIEAISKDSNRPWGIYYGNVYDLTDYVYTLGRYGKVRSANAPNWNFLPEKLVSVFVDNPGTDISSLLDEVLTQDIKNSTLSNAGMNCLKNAFYVGKVDNRKTARCQANGIILVAFAGIITAVIVIKFLAALQLGTKRKPAMQDKFVICQIPAYTEGEDQLRKALDSLTALQYDNKRKLLCVICDGMVVGGGNDRPTPNIVLEILGVDPKIDPPALPFKSVGEGSAQLNYGKVYSGLYEYEGKRTRLPFGPCIPNTAANDIRSQAVLYHTSSLLRWGSLQRPLNLEIVESVTPRSSCFNSSTESTTVLPWHLLNWRCFIKSIILSELIQSCTNICSWLTPILVSKKTP